MFFKHFISKLYLILVVLKGDIIQQHIDS